MKAPLFRFNSLAIFFIALANCFHPRPAAAQRPLGIDVSSFQGTDDSPPTNIIWTNVKSSGISFAWTKATEGVGFEDSDFVVNETGAKSAGVLIGAYHFARPDLNNGIAGANAEAAYFWGIAKNYVQNGGAYLMPMLDIEHELTNASPRYTQATLSAWVNQWCQQIVNLGKTNGVVVKPVVYTFTSYATGTPTYGPGFDTTVLQWPLWMADYPGSPAPQTGNPSPFAPWTHWFFWQYGSTGTISGIVGNCDQDVFNGDTNALLSAFVIGNLPPTNLTVNPGSNATFNVTANGSSLRYQWQFNKANIPGATAASYTVTNPQPANAGPYSVIVSNGTAPLFTAIASLGIASPLTNKPGAALAPTSLVDWLTADSNPNDIFGTNNYTPFNNVTYVPGEQGQAFHFDGATTYLSNQLTSVALPWTACFWVNRQNAPGTAAALTGDGTNELKLEQFGTTREVGYTQFGVGDFAFTYTVPTGVWTHLAFVATTAGVSLYTNGVLQGTIANTIPLPLGYIGAGYVASTGKFVDYLLGSLDEILAFKRALTAAEIHSIYAAGSAGLVRAPQITSAVAVNGQFQLQLEGQTGKNYTIHSSTNLLTWQTVSTLANPSGTNQFTNPTATNAQTFYRISQP